MNIKSITTLGLVAVALAVTSVAPAFANNNNAYMNQLAMQMYAQNQAAAPTNPWLNGTIPVNYQAPVYGAATNPYAAYGAPYTNVVSPQVIYRNVAVHHVVVRHDGYRDHFHR